MNTKSLPKSLTIGDKIECRTGNGDEQTYTPWIDGIVTGFDGRYGFFVRVDYVSAITGMRSTNPIGGLFRTLQISRAWNTENKYWRRVPEENGKPHE